MHDNPSSHMPSGSQTQPSAPWGQSCGSPEELSSLELSVASIEPVEDESEPTVDDPLEPPVDDPVVDSCPDTPIPLPSVVPAPVSVPGCGSDPAAWVASSPPQPLASKSTNESTGELNFIARWTAYTLLSSLFTCAADQRASGRRSETQRDQCVSSI